MPDIQDDELGLLQIGAILRAGWKFIATSTIIFVAAAVMYLNNAAYLYTAELRVTPVESSASAGKLAGLAGLASVAGLSLPQDSSGMSFSLYLAGLRSREVAERLADQPEIRRTLFANEWNEQRQTFEEPSSPLGAFAKGLKKVLGLPIYAWTPPDAARLHDRLQQDLVVVQDPKTPVVTISFSHTDPEFAARLLTATHEAVDAYLRRKALARSGQYISYLSTKLATVTLAEHRAAIAEALSEQERTRMLASSSLAYAAEPFGRAVVSMKPTSPRPAVVLSIALIVGLLAGGLAVLARHHFRSRISDAVDSDA